MTEKARKPTSIQDSVLYNSEVGLTDETRVLIRRLAEENPTWGAPKVHGEHQKLGSEVSERSVARYLGRIRGRGDPAKRWLSFLRNHRKAIVAFDFFTVPTVRFS